ncbi:hypothetical protein [Bacillus sp. AG4(2022)]|uniref:hypothetical protein n=1 Tax=Bacillus TaxID=1386 RepID=UPI0028815DC4|nr:hypothetical protein [Bacillus sp. AG4(2022)]MDT0160560.1 hypothetical protein [Bacillus sp. AG4(2022)]
MNNDYAYLLSQYRQLWNNRRLEGTGSAEDILKEAIRRELKDENAHPRARKRVAEKFYLAVKRLTDSDMPNEDKLFLIDMHCQVYEQIRS